MKKFIALFLFLASALAGATNFPALHGVLLPPGPDALYGLNQQAGAIFLRHKLGTRVVEGHTTAYGAYDFSKQGGAIGSYDSGIHLPNGAVIRQVFFDVITAGTTSASGTVSFDANSTGDLKAALAAASWTGEVAGIPVGSAATMVKLTAARTLYFSIATGALTAGKINAYVDYVLQTY